MVVAAPLAIALTLAAAPPLMTRQQIIDRAKPAVGYSYHWGGACWRTDGTQHGSCSGSCPDCTHSGSYGADCSGYVFKAWQIDGAEAVTHCGHGPYTASSYHNNQTHWTHITRANAKAADILASTTHVVIIESGDPWGTPRILEARGCSYGVQRNTRSLGSTYNASERDNLGAPPPPTWKATFVAQSYPYSSAPAIEMKEGDVIEGWFKLKNDGAHAWSSTTKLAPTPRDRASSLADDSWLSPTRVSTAGNVAPGATGTFPLTIRAGSTGGEHVQTFNLVAEGAAWFSDSGGPSDTQLAIRVRVQARDHAGALVAASFDDEPITIVQGETATAFVEVRNDGHVTWDGDVRLAPTPRDQPSSLAAPSWLSPTRVATPDQATAEGEVARFTFELGGNDVGDFEQTFGLVHEGVVWFADGGFSPSDDFVRVKVRVLPPPPPVEILAHPSSSSSSGAPPRQVQLPVEGGCAQASGAPACSVLALAAFALLRARRRRRAVCSAPCASCCSPR